MEKIITLKATRVAENKINLDLKIHGNNDDLMAIRVLANAIQQLLDGNETGLTVKIVEK